MERRLYGNEARERKLIVGVYCDWRKQVRESGGHFEESVSSTNNLYALELFLVVGIEHRREERSGTCVIL